MEITPSQYAAIPAKFDRFLRSNPVPLGRFDVIVYAIQNQTPTVPLDCAAWILLCSLAFTTTTALLEKHQRKFLFQKLHHALNQGKISDKLADKYGEAVLNPEGFYKYLLPDLITSFSA